MKQPAPEAIPAAPADRRVTHLFLNPLLTGGADFDGQPGDEGLSVLIEPRNSADEYVPQAGAVSIVVLDPSRSGETARIARWDFTLTNAQQKLDSSAARGIQLEMPWPATAPASNRLRVFVRYETADGRRLQTDREIFISPPGQVANRWTPRPADRTQPAGDASGGAVGKAALPPAPLTANGGKVVGAAAMAPAEKGPTALPKVSSPPAELSGVAKPSSGPLSSWSPHR